MAGNCIKTYFPFFYGLSYTRSEALLIRQPLVYSSRSRGDAYCISIQEVFFLRGYQINYCSRIIHITHSVLSNTEYIFFIQ